MLEVKKKQLELLSFPCAAAGIENNLRNYTSTANMCELFECNSRFRNTTNRRVKIPRSPSDFFSLHRYSAKIAFISYRIF